MQEQLDIRQEMSAVRNRGLANATMLAKRVEKLSDWREHVRAHPWPIALAVGAVAYWVMPTKHVSRLPPQAAHETVSRTGTGAVAPASTREEKVANAASVRGAALGFIGSLVGNALRSYVTDQVQSLITPRGSHATPQQRQTSYSDF